MKASNEISFKITGVMPREVNLDAMNKKGFDKEIKIIRHPSPELVYHMNLLYLSKLCELLSEKYNKEFI